LNKFSNQADEVPLTHVLKIMSTKPPPSSKEVPAVPTNVTGEQDVIQPPKEQLGAHPTPVEPVERENQHSSNSALLSADSSRRTESRHLTLKEVPSYGFALGERVPISLHEEESFGKKLSYWGPFITSILSIGLTVVVWLNAEKLSEQQIRLQDRQTQLQEEQVKGELSDMRSKFFTDLTSTDESKKTFAAIGLAGHGLKAMPVVHLALGVEEGEIRQSAVNVVYRLFQAEMTLDGRKQLLEQLMKEFDSPNQTLHTGVVQSLVKIEPLMDPNEHQQVSKFFQDRIPPQGNCSEQQGRDLVQEVAKFFNPKDGNSVPYLLAIAKHPKCGDGWLQAMLKLQASIQELPLPARADLLEKIKQLKVDVLESLREQVSDEDLAEGTGFGKFGRKGQMSISFVEFRRRVEEEFNALVP
jgi:hypothetical protein